MANHKRTCCGLILVNDFKCLDCPVMDRSAAQPGEDREDWADSVLINRPIGVLRTKAYDAFNPIWREKLCSRARAYVLLAQELQLESHACHMRWMDAETCLRVPAAAKAIRQRLTGPYTASE